MNNTFELFGLTIYWYGVILTSAMIVALFLFLYLGKKRGVSSDFALTMFLFAVVFGIFGARLFYVLPRSEYWSSWSGFLQAFDIREGGLTIMGAIPMGALGIVISCIIYKKSPMRITDIVAPCLLIGQVIGRWGNFVNQELHGIEVVEEWLKFFPMAVNIDGTWFYASFFYEMMLNLLGFIIAMVIFFRIGKKLKPGIMTLGYLLWYMVVRASLEFIKDGAIMIGGVRVIQTICFVAIPILIVIMILTQKGIIKFETQKMYMAHFGLAYDPPEYVENTPSITNDSIINNDNLTNTNQGEDNITKNKNNDNVAKNKEKDNNE